MYSKKFLFTNTTCIDLKRELICIFLLLLVLPTYGQTLRISGLISDSKTGERIIGATVNCQYVSVASNNIGFYSIAVPPGNISIDCEYAGYESQTITLSLTKDTVINFLLPPFQSLKEVVVSARQFSNLDGVAPGSIDIPLGLIKATPALLGEKDILKTIQLLPGVQSGSTGLCGLYVRGGGSDENLMLLDGMSLYNAEHMLGLFSVFMPQAVKKVTFYKGGFPARYGGRLSSVMDLRTKDGNTEHLSGEFSINLLSTEAHLEGPVADSSTTFSISGRLMNSIVAAPIIYSIDRKEKGDYWFYDIDGKITHRFSSKDILSINIYNGADKLYVHEDVDMNLSHKDYSNTKTDSDVIWGNTQVRASWDHIYGSRLFSTIFLGNNHYRMHTDIHEEYSHFAEDSCYIHSKSDMLYKSDMDDICLNIDFDYIPTNTQHLRFGMESILHRFSPETYGMRFREYDMDNAMATDTTAHSNNNVIRATELSAYIEDDFHITDAISILPGIRFNVFNVRGKTYLSPQPRLAAKYLIGNFLAIKVGYSRMGQNVHLLTSSKLTLPTDLWVPATENLKPMISNQFCTGIYSEFSSWQISLEGYYKSIQNVLEYKDGAPALGNSSSWEDKVETGIGRSYGAELLIQKTKGPTTGWLSYCISKTERRFPDGSINRGEWFPYKYDRRHSVDILINQNLGSNIDLSATWSFATGGVTTIPQRQTVILCPDGNELQQIDVTYDRGNYRLQPSHLLNISFNWHRKKSKGLATWTASIYNAYNQMNPDMVLNNLTMRRLSSQIYVAKRTVKNVTFIPIMPSVGYSFKF